MTKEQEKALFVAAQKRVAAMDKTDGMATADHPIDIGLRTVMTAIATGMGIEDFSIIAEALAMLVQIEHKARGKGEPFTPFL